MNADTNTTSPPSTPTAISKQQEQPHSGWRTFLSSVGNYISTPFMRKRPAEDAESEVLPAQKRTRIEEPQSITTYDLTENTPSAATNLQLERTEVDDTTEMEGQDLDQNTPLPAAKVQRRRIGEDSDMVMKTQGLGQGTPQAIKKAQRKRAVEHGDTEMEIHDLEETTPQPSTQLQRKRPAEDDDETETASRNKRMRTEDVQRTPHSGQRESPRDYAGPSTKNPKLPTSLSTITEYTEPSRLSSITDTTPSKPPRAMPQRLPPPSSTPLIRRAAQVRAARAAQSGKVAPTYAWEMRTATPKPREPNADARLAKLERMKALEKELEELKKDEDIMEMQSHRRKRVKIDNLRTIPHNKPGDSAGTFRVPEPDSDDEIEVMEDVEVSSNVFDEDKEEEPEVPVFTFPDVGLQADDYHVTPEYQEACGQLFAEGFNEWVAQGMPMDVELEA